MRRAPAAIPVVGSLLAAALLLPAGPTRAAFQLRYEPLFTAGESTTTDALGTTLESSTTTWTHLAAARFDRSLAERLRLLANGNYEWGLGTVSSAGRTSEFDGRTWNAHAQLMLGPRELNFIPYYTRSEKSFDTLEDGLARRTPRSVRATYGGHAAWRPEGLPSIGVRFARTDLEEGGGAIADDRTTEASLEAAYIVENTDLRYRLDYANPEDRLSGMESVNLRHQGRASYENRFFDDRASFSGSYVLNIATTDVRVPGEGGVVDTRQSPIAGLSAIEVPPATPTSIVLAQTPELVDANRTVGVGIDLGFGSDTAPRHVGAQLANAITPVNVVLVWVNQPLPDAVARAFVWTAYRSEDNLTWTPVAVTGPVAFGTFENRFEIPIERTEARYLKVVTRPLPPGTILDPRFADILVTEIELLERVPAADVRGRTGRTSGTASASVRAKLLADRRLFYDFGLNVTHSSREVANRTDTSFTYDVSNGISYDQALGRFLTFSARADRADSRQGDRRQASTRVLASLGAAPFPALTSSATYTGALTQTPEGNVITNIVVASMQAQPYQGVSLNASGSAGIASQRGLTSRMHSAAVSSTVAPHRALTLSGTFSENSSRTDAVGKVQSSTRQMEGGLTFAPVEAFYFAGSIGRVEVGGRAQRIANVSGSVRPFPRGAVYLTMRYEESYTSFFETRTRTWGPSLRWNIHGGNYLESSYTVQDTSTTLTATSLSLFAAKLSLLL